MYDIDKFWYSRSKGVAECFMQHELCIPDGYKTIGEALNNGYCRCFIAQNVLFLEYGDKKVGQKCVKAMLDVVAFEEVVIDDLRNLRRIFIKGEELDLFIKYGKLPDDSDEGNVNWEVWLVSDPIRFSFNVYGSDKAISEAISDEYQP